MRGHVIRLLALTLLLSLFAPLALAQEIPSYVNPQQMGHPTYLKTVEGTEKAYEQIDSYSKPTPGKLDGEVANTETTFSRPMYLGVSSGDADRILYLVRRLNRPESRFFVTTSDHAIFEVRRSGDNYTIKQVK